MRYLPALLLLSLAACDEDLADANDPADYEPEAMATEEAPPPIVLSVAGTCPGPATVTISGATPSSPWAIVASPILAPGMPIPSGPCAGTFLRVGPPATLGPTGTANAMGVSSFGVMLPPAACGLYVQPVDIASCSTGMFLQL
jgi:hypothetical protein